MIDQKACESVAQRSGAGSKTRCRTHRETPMSGRKTTLTPALQNRICKLLAQGSTINGACALCAISSRTYREWCDRGEAGEEPFSSFLSAVTRARELSKNKLVRSIIGDRDWRARAWYLERCYPQEFGRVTAGDEQSSPRPWPRVIFINQRPADSPEDQRLGAELPDHYKIQNLDGSVERIPIDDNAVRVNVELHENEETRELRRRFNHRENHSSDHHDGGANERVR